MAQPASARAHTLLYVVTVATTADLLLRGQLRWMRERGWNVHLIVGEDTDLSAIAEREGVDVHVVPFAREISPRSDLNSVRALRRKIAEIDPDVINYSTPKASLLASIASASARVKRRVYVVRGLRLEGMTGLGRALMWGTEMVTLLSSTDAFAVSPSLKKRMRQLRLPRASSVRIPAGGSSNGVQAHDIARRVAQIDPAEARQTLNIPAEAFVVLYVGRVTLDKGVGDLAEAMRDERLADAVLVTAGTVEDETAAGLFAPLGSRWVGMTHRSDLAPVWAAADVLCLPTYREGMPNVVLEASAAGLPVVTTDATGAQDAVLPEQTGIRVPMRNPAAIAEALVKLGRDESLRSRLGSAGAQWVRQEFDPERVWRSYAAAYSA